MTDWQCDVAPIAPPPGSFEWRAALIRPPESTRRTPTPVALAAWTSSQKREHAPVPLLAQPYASWLTPELAQRATSVLRRTIDARLGGTWWGRAPTIAATGRAVVFASTDRAITLRLLQQAIDRAGPRAVLLVAPRPGRLRAAAAARGLAPHQVLDGILDPWPLIEEADSVHAAPRSDPALIAGLLGKAGVDPLHLAAALLRATTYRDPFDGQPIPAERFLDHAEDWRRHAATKASIACCVGMSFWKRGRMAATLGTARPPAFRRAAPAAIALATARRGAIAVWPSRQPPALPALAAQAAIPLIRVEDGFIRSVGLGAEFRPPLSVVFDRLGLYYDATTPSDLEDLLAHARFDTPLLARAAALRERMVRERVTKYNLDGAAPIPAPAGRRIVLVPGQVADDRSVQLGGGGAGAGLDLLARVRAQAPGAHIIYKPHPDVEAGFRIGAIPDADARRYADQIVRGGSMAALLEQVDEVHTLTSLTGFEALLRGKPVTTYGQPFYAGWGLATDLNPPPRRTRRLPLDALVAATLILYPCYIDPVTLLPCGPEVVLDRLADPALHRLTPLMRLRRLQGQILAAVSRNRLRSTPRPERPAP